MSAPTNPTPSRVELGDVAGVTNEFEAVMSSNDRDCVESCLAHYYIDHNPFVPDGSHANRFGTARFARFAPFPHIEVTPEDVVVEAGNQGANHTAGRFTYCATFQGTLLSLQSTHTSATDAS